MKISPIGRRDGWLWISGHGNTIKWIQPSCLKCGYLIRSEGAHRYKCYTKSCPVRNLNESRIKWLNNNNKKFDSKGNYKTTVKQ